MWLGLDGEGIGRAPHRYVMLCSADSAGWRDYVEDVNGLSTDACLRFLFTLPAARTQHRGSDMRVAGYYLSYDWTMILRDLPNRAIFRLLRPELRARPKNEGGGFSPVRWRGYALHYLAGMMRIARGSRSITVWDVGKYYQCRFVQALENSGIAAPELIRRMKLERGTWIESDLDRMRAYCLEECTHLARLTELLESQHNAIGLHPTAWHGPGSTAGALFAAHGIDQYLKEPPAPVEDCANRAYFGGRFEHSLIGIRDSVTAYDVRSAYPAAMTALPCLAHGRWVHQTRLPRQDATACIRYRITDIGDRVWGPLPCRLPDGTICWPRAGTSGWAWSVEFWAAQRGWKGVEFAGEAWVLRSGCKCHPFDFMHELYNWRISKPENIQVVKLAANSGYGKTAQRIRSKYSSRIWAGIITATCRARMLELITRHGDESHLLAIATDGAYSTESLDIEAPGLGSWEVEHEGRMTFLRPGIYWSAEKVRARGIGRRHLTEQMALAEQAITEHQSRLSMGTSVHFGNARQCVYATPSGVLRRSKAYGEWLDLPVTLSLAPAPKRTDDWRPPALEGVESAPYGAVSADARRLQALGLLLEGRMTSGR